MQMVKSMNGFRGSFRSYRVVLFNSVFAKATRNLILIIIILQYAGACAFGECNESGSIEWNYVSSSLDQPPHHRLNKLSRIVIRIR